MSDNRAWRLEVELFAPGGGHGSGRMRSRRAKIIAALRESLGREVVLEEAGSRLVVRAFKNSQIEQARLALDAALLANGGVATVRVTHREQPDGEWVERSKPYRAPRSRHAGRLPRARAPLVSRRAKLRWLAAMIVAAFAGATYYALAPGVASYQVGFVLILPLLLVVLFVLHRRLPVRMQWTLAIVLAAAGPIAYLAYGGSQWWAWGRLATVPFVLLAIGRGVSRAARGGRREPWYGGHIEGPWGPP